MDEVSKPFLSLFVACYNEELNIADTLDVLTTALAEFDFSWEIIVIDDASQDRSVEVVREYAAKHPELPIELRVNPKNMGLAHNYVEGAFMARGRYYRLVCGDNVEPKETLVQVFRSIGDADMVIPYQIASDRGQARKLLSGLYTRIINFITGQHIRYYNGLAVHTRYNVMRYHSSSSGFSFQADMITTLLDMGFSYVEVPVVANDRHAGKSTALSLKNLLSVAHTLLEIFLRRLRKRFFGR